MARKLDVWFFTNRVGTLNFAGLLPAIADKLRCDPQQGFSGNGLIDQIYDLIEQRCVLTIKRLTSSAFS